jgi:2-desacetyl-2-hydroxyethyl bacteriochlorophyllide A dehydrogenase
MRAAVFHGAGEGLRIESLPDPEPGSGEIVFKIARCGICGSDIHMTNGHGMQYPIGMIPGHEYAGEVVAVGSGVTNVNLGDRVSVMPLTGCGRCAACRAGTPQFCDQMGANGGGFAEYAKAGAQQCILLPKSLTLADGALVEPMAVGYHGVAISGITPESKVLVLGAGPIGLCAVFWARRFNAARIAVAATSLRRSEYAYSMGADVFLDPERPVADAVIEALGGPPDIVFECAGVVGMLDQSVQVVRRRGTVVVLGICTVPDPFLPVTAVFKEVKLQFSITYSLSEFEAVARTFDAGHVEARSMISQTVPLSELPAFFETLHRSNNQCKVLVDPGS